MSKTNIQLVREFIEEVQNRKHFDRFFDFFNKDAVMHIAPYVGLGVTTDDHSGDKLVVVEVAPHGPARGKLMPGDVIVSMQDDQRTWATFDELKTGLWGQGVPGTHLTATVRRDGKLETVPLIRGRVDGWEMKLDKVVNLWRDDVMKNWPDLHMSIELIFGSDDLVTCYSIVSGTNAEYHRAATWSGCDIYRIKNGKIVESWGVEDEFSRMKQLGYRIAEPVKELV